MRFFPQLQTGCVAQWPLDKAADTGTVMQEAPGGRIWRADRVTGDSTRWRLRFEGLSATEKDAIEDLYRWTGGGLREFAFVDPAANLLSWSEDLTRDVWLKEGGLSCMAAGAEAGRGPAWQATNFGGAPCSLSQAVPDEWGYQFCFSVELRAAVSTAATIYAGEAQAIVHAGSDWQRFYVAGEGPQFQSRAGLIVPAGASLELREPQLEAQVTPSSYKPSGGLNGVHTRARFQGSSLTIRSTGPGIFSIEATIWSPEVR